MSTWIETSRQSPIFRIGISAIALVVPRCLPAARSTMVLPRAVQGKPQRIRHGGLGNDVQLQPEMHDGLGDLRPDAAEDAVGAHQPRGGDRLDQVLRDQRIHRGHAGDVDDGDFGART